MAGAEQWAATPLRTSYEGEPLVLVAVRGELGRWLARQGFSPEVVSRAQLLVSELATNAVEAAPGQPFEVTARRVGPDTVAVAVSNAVSTTRPPPRIQWRTPEPLAPRGRGLAIAAALADAIDIVDDGPGTVTIEARLVDRTAAGGPSQQEGWP